MERLAAFTLIYFLDFYFTLMFIVGTYRRFSQYQSIGKLAFSGPKRWPRLLNLIQHHRAIFITWTTVLPLLLAALLMAVQFIASRLIWPQAGQPPHGLTLGVLFTYWPVLIFVLPLAVAMIGLDIYFLYNV